MEQKFSAKLFFCYCDYCKNFCDFLIFCIVLWNINYDYSKSFIKKIVNNSKFKNWHDCEKVLRDKRLPFRLPYKFLCRESDIEFLFFILLELDIRLSTNLRDKLCNYIQPIMMKFYFCDLCKSYFILLKKGQLKDYKFLSYKARLKYFISHIPKHIPIDKSSNEAKTNSNLEFKPFYASATNVWGTDFFTENRRPKFKSIPFGGQKKR